MNENDVVLGLVAREGQEGLKGRTLLQKKIYFYSVLSDQDFGFVPHYYGPYSALISNTVDHLVSNGFLKEVVETFSSESSVFGEKRRHTYFLSEDGEHVLQQRGINETIRNVLTRIEGHPIAYDLDLMSIAAKVHFLLSHRRGGTVKEIEGLAREFNWELSSEQVSSVVDYLVHLGLVVREQKQSG